MWQIAAAGDRALLASLGDVMSPDALSLVLALDRALRRAKPPGLLSVIPAYASLLCEYNPAVTDFERLASAIRGIRLPVRPSLERGRLHEVPTRYHGPDLERVSAHTRLSADDIVSLHTSSEYLVYCLGFAPGFTYCGQLPESLETPRLPAPRLRVVPGSVGIAGRQTGIYAVESPGGWNVIGHTELALFRLNRRPPVLFRPGDRVRFRRVR